MRFRGCGGACCRLLRSAFAANGWRGAGWAATPSGYSAVMPFVDPRELRPRQPLAGWNGRFFHSDHMTFVYYEIDADAVAIHEHQHPEEEVWNVVEGTLAITIDGVEHVAGPGCAAIVPPNTPHSTRALSASRAIVVDFPVRARVGGVATD